MAAVFTRGSKTNGLCLGFSGASPIGSMWRSILVLSITGFYISDPFIGTVGIATNEFLMGTVRFIHFVTAFVFTSSVLFRIYWALAGFAPALLTGINLFPPPSIVGALWAGCCGITPSCARIHQLRSVTTLWQA